MRSDKRTDIVKKNKIYIDNLTSIDVWESPTFTADIYVGLKPGYEGRIPGFAMERARKICQEYCDLVGFAVTFEATEFIYTGGNEQGIKVGLINYPRYPSEKAQILRHALILADRLKHVLDQYRVSIVTSDTTYMLGEME